METQGHLPISKWPVMKKAPEIVPVINISAYV